MKYSSLRSCILTGIYASPFEDISIYTLLFIVAEKARFKGGDNEGNRDRAHYGQGIKFSMILHIFGMFNEAGTYLIYWVWLSTGDWRGIIGKWSLYSNCVDEVIYTGGAVSTILFQTVVLFRNEFIGNSLRQLRFMQLQK